MLSRRLQRQLERLHHFLRALEHRRHLVALGRDVVNLRNRIRERAVRLILIHINMHRERAERILFLRRHFLFDRSRVKRRFERRSSCRLA